MEREGTRFDGSYPHVFITFGASVSKIKHTAKYCDCNRVEIKFE